MTDANILLMWLRYERIDGVPDEERRRQCATLIEQQAAALARCRGVLALAVSTPFDCSGFHHAKKDRHLISQSCPIEVRARAALRESQGKT